MEPVVATRRITPSPITRSDQGNVPANIPGLPNKVGTKFINEDAVPASFFTQVSNTSIAKGRISASITVKGKNDSKNKPGLQLPTVISKIPDSADTKNIKR